MYKLELKLSRLLVVKRFEVHSPGLCAREAARVSTHSDSPKETRSCDARTDERVQLSQIGDCPPANDPETASAPPTHAPLPLDL